MANFASALKGEISRLARKELRSETEHLRKASLQYRTEISELKRRVTVLEQQQSRLATTLKNSSEVNVNSEIKTDGEVGTKARITANGFKTLRRRLGLTAETIGGLLNVSAQTIYNWEAGKSSPRQQQMKRIVVLRGMGKKEVATILKQLTE